MKKKRVLKKSLIQKLFLIFFGIFLAFVFLEVFLRVGGFVLSSYQRAHNKEDLDAEYRILCLGESTTAFGGTSSWPAYLERILNNKSKDIKFKVFNEGLAGTRTVFILSKLDENLEKYNPNIVITMMGVNDREISVIYKNDIKNENYLILKSFRVYKLIKLIIDSFKNLIGKNNVLEKSDDLLNQEEEFMKKLEKNPDNVNLYVGLSKVYIKMDNYYEAEEVLKEGLEKDPEYGAIYASLGKIYMKQDRYDEAEEVLKEGLEKDPEYVYIYKKLSELYLDAGEDKEAERIINICSEKNNNIYINEKSDEVYIGSMNIHENNKITEGKIEIEIKERDYYGMFSDVTKYHYNELYNELKKRDIKYIAMQYPTMDVNDLKIMFDEDDKKDIIFVSNKENFNDALAEEDYWNYFVDKLANGSFGHCTPKGNRLIAENVAGIILNELNISSKGE